MRSEATSFLLSAGALRAQVQHPLRLAGDAYGHGPREKVRWTIGERVVLESAQATWTPSLPGLFRLDIDVAGDVQQRLLSVGITPAQAAGHHRARLVLAVPEDHRIHLLDVTPFAGRGGAPEKPAKGAADRARAARRRETAAGHPAFVRLMREQSSLFQRHLVLNTPRIVAAGLYAVFPTDTVFLGAGPRLAALVRELDLVLRALRRGLPGAGSLWRQAHGALAAFPFPDLRYGSGVVYPATPSLAGYARRARASRGLHGVFAALARFGAAVGSMPGDSLAVITSNRRAGTLSSKFIDPSAGIYRQALSSATLPVSSSTPSGLATAGSGFGPNLAGDPSGQWAMEGDGGSGRWFTGNSDTNETHTHGDWSTGVWYKKDANGDYQDTPNQDPNHSNEVGTFVRVDATGNFEITMRGPNTSGPNTSGPNTGANNSGPAENGPPQGGSTPSSGPRPEGPGIETGERSDSSPVIEVYAYGDSVVLQPGDVVLPLADGSGFKVVHDPEHIGFGGTDGLPSSDPDHPRAGESVTPQPGEAIFPDDAGSSSFERIPGPKDTPPEPDEPDDTTDDDGNDDSDTTETDGKEPNPLDFGTGGGDQGSVHLVVVNGRLTWVVRPADLAVTTRGGGCTDGDPRESSGTAGSGLNITPGGGVTDGPDDPYGGFDAGAAFHPPLQGAIDPGPDFASYNRNGAVTVRAATRPVLGGFVRTFSGMTATGGNAGHLVAALVIRL